MVRVLALGTLVCLLCLNANADVTYTYDDGSPDNAVGVTDVGNYDLFWGNRFVVIPSASQITSISVCFGFIGTDGLSIGSPIELLIYEDLDGGDTRNAVLLRNIPQVVQTLDFGAFNTYSVPPTPV